MKVTTSAACRRDHAGAVVFCSALIKPPADRWRQGWAWASMQLRTFSDGHQICKLLASPAADVQPPTTTHKHGAPGADGTAVVGGHMIPERVWNIPSILPIPPSSCDTPEKPHPFHAATARASLTSQGWRPRPRAQADAGPELRAAP